MAGARPRAVRRRPPPAGRGGRRGRRAGERARPGVQGHRPDRRRRLPARGPGGVALGAPVPRRPSPGGRPARRPARPTPTAWRSSSRPMISRDSLPDWSASPCGGASRTRCGRPSPMSAPRAPDLHARGSDHRDSRLWWSDRTGRSGGPMPQNAWPATEPTEVSADLGRRRAWPSTCAAVACARSPSATGTSSTAIRRARSRRAAAAACCCPGPTASATAAGRGRAGTSSSTSRRRRSRPRCTAWSPAQPWTVLDEADDRVTVGHRRRAAVRLSVPTGRRDRLRPDPRPARGHRAGAQRRRRRRARSASACTRTSPSGRRRTATSADAELELPARTRWTSTTAACPPAERRRFDGAVGRIGDRAFDDPLTDLARDDDGWARVRLRGPAGRARARRRRVVALAAGLQRRHAAGRASAGAAWRSSR